MITFKFLLVWILLVAIISFFIKYVIHKVGEQEVYLKRLLNPSSLWVNKDNKVVQIINVFENDFGIFYVRYTVLDCNYHFGEPIVSKVSIFLDEYNKVTPTV